MAGLPDFQIRKTYDIMPLSEITPWGVAAVRSPEALRETMGEDIEVAVFDTPNGQHPDLVPNLLPAYDCVNIHEPDPERGEQPMPLPEIVPVNKQITGNPHSTHVMGSIAAAINEDGVTGVAPKARIRPVWVLANNGSGDNYSIYAGAHYVDVQRRLYDATGGRQGSNCEVANWSLGSTQPDPLLRQAVQMLSDAGITVVAAAGNSGMVGMAYPAKWCDEIDGLIAVAAVDHQFNIAYFSSRGNVFVAAPGVSVLSCWPPGLADADGKFPAYATFDGTSMASPHVAGEVALFRSWFKKKHGRQPAHAEVKQYLKDRASRRDLGAPGRDPEFGWGFPTFEVPATTPAPAPAPQPTPAPAPAPQPAPEPPAPKPAGKLLIGAAFFYAESRDFPLSTPPVLLYGGSYGPARDILAALGWEAKDSASRVTATKGQDGLYLTTTQVRITRAGVAKTVKLADRAARLRGAWLMPLREVLQALGYRLTWDAQTQAIALWEDRTMVVVPVPGPITGRWGDTVYQNGRNIYQHNGYGYHRGVDIGCPAGTPVRAALSGRVLWAGWNNSMGYTVVLEHACRGRYDRSVSAHLSELHISPGWEVAGGQIVGLSGGTGEASDGDHLHYEIVHGCPWGEVGGDLWPLIRGDELGADPACVFEERRWPEEGVPRP